MKKYNIILAIIMVVTIVLNSSYVILNNMATGLQVFKNYIEIQFVNFNNNEYTVEIYKNDKIINNDKIDLSHSDKDTVKCIYKTDNTYSVRDELKLKVNVKKNNGVIIGRNIDIKPFTEQNLFYEFDCEKGELIPAKERKIGIPKTISELFNSMLLIFTVVCDTVFAVYLIIYFKKRIDISNNEKNVDKKD